MAAATLNVSSMRIVISMGCPQVCCGCFCGALLFDASIARLSGGEIHIQVYATTFVFLQWENSQTQCQGSCNGPVIL